MGRAVVLRWLCLILSIASCGPTENLSDVSEISGVTVRFPRTQRSVWFVAEADTVTHAYWKSTQGFQIVTSDGLLVATRGFGYDLILLDPDPTRIAFSGGASVYERKLGMIDGRYQYHHSVLQCVMRYETSRKWIEHCTGFVDFFNTYRLGADQQILESQQWVSEQVGHIQIATPQLRSNIHIPSN